MSALLAPPQKLKLKDCPPLESGDHLDAAEFMRRYEAMESRGDERRAELINGVVYLMFPAHLESHGRSDSVIQQWLAHYSTFATDVCHAINTTVLLGRKNVPQPDGLLWHTKGGNAVRTDDDYLKGAPELVAETSASTASFDSHEKLKAYLKGGVKEYIIWRTLDGELDWFVAENGKYIHLVPDKTGVIRSRYFKGLWLNVPALLAHDRRAVLRTLEDGLRSSGKL